MAVLGDRRQEPAGLVPLTVEQYHRMIEAGILEEGAAIELLDGQLAWKIRGERMTVNPAHPAVVNRLIALAEELRTRGCHFRAQCPVTLPPHDEPEPDGSIARGSLDEYTDRHPGGGDLSCVIEVADSSLDRDRTTKQRVYAASGIPQYVIVNLVDGTVEVFAEPDPATGRYHSRRVLASEDTIDFLLPDGTRHPFPVRRVLP